MRVCVFVCFEGVGCCQSESVKHEGGVVVVGGGGVALGNDANISSFALSLYFFN